MPAPGDQHRDTHASVNPFIEKRPHIGEFTAQEIATLQSRLEKQLGPEFISTRPGNGGGKVHYLAAEKVINLANEVFGFNGWNSSIQNVQIDFVDENQETGRINLGLSTIVRVTLRDGTYHEDIGYGHCENTKGKAAAFEKAKKEAATDALKRALRNFGNVLGNCLYDKDYLQKVTKVKVAPSKWDAQNLHRHPDYAPVKRDPDYAPVKGEPHDVQDAPNRTNTAQRNISIQSAPSVASFGSGEFDDDFGGNELDETDFNHPDEVRIDDSETGNDHRRPSLAPHATDELQRNPSRQNTSRNHYTPQSRPQNVPPPPSIQGPQAPQRPQAVSRPPQPPTRMMPPQTPGNQPRQQMQGPGNGQVAHPTHGAKSNSSSGATTDSPSRTVAQQPSADSGGQGASDELPVQQPPPGVPLGFVSGRAAEQPTADATFNIHAESPSIRRTQGINPKKSEPVRRKMLANGQVAPPAVLPGTVSPVIGNALAESKPVAANYINPSADSNRKIGMPQQNRNAYKPPQVVKRPAMSDVTNTYSTGTDGASDGKRPKLDQQAESQAGEG